MCSPSHVCLGDRPLAPTDPLDSGPTAPGATTTASAGPVGHHPGEERPLWYRLWELVKVVLPAGCYAFGGPTAHLAVFHDLFVEKLKWLNDQVRCGGG